MKKMMMSMMVMIMASSMAMNANNVSTANNKGNNNNVAVVDNHGHGHNKGHKDNKGPGNDVHHKGHLGHNDHHAFDRHFMAEVDRHCMKMDRNNRGFRWTKRMIRAHRGDRHIYTHEVVKGYRTGHMVCTVCGFHAW